MEYTIIEALQSAMEGCVSTKMEQFDTKTEFSVDTTADYEAAVKGKGLIDIESAAEEMAYGRKEEGFISGFRMGFHLAMEIFTPSEKPTPCPSSTSSGRHTAA